MSSLINGVAKDVKNDLNTKNLRVPWWYWVSLVIVSTIVSWLLFETRKTVLLVPVLCSVFVLSVVIAMKWQLSGYLWFRIAMVLLAALHGVLIAFIPWTDEFFSGPTILYVLVDTLITLTIVDLIGRIINPTGFQAQRGGHHAPDRDIERDG